MKSTIKLALLPSILLMSAAAFAAGTIDQTEMQFTGSIVTNLSSNCTISAPTSIDLGKINITDIIASGEGTDINPVDFKVSVRDCPAYQHVQIRINATPDSDNAAFAANPQGAGNAAYVGVAFREVIDGGSTLVPPMTAATPDEANSDGVVTHDFTASITKSSVKTPSPGNILVAATLTLEAI